MSFYTALTGLNAATASLGVISNNIANVGTTGFKKIACRLRRHFCYFALAEGFIGYWPGCGA